ncbi:MAG: glycosyltransferase, partial [Candidatus Cloacimonetes bacterium]|nr:glycosyltransferase [Candidatus Cloacimonadota bacterium]
HLGKSKILALARPSSLQASGGFPTKLGEYLSTGVPVVVTRVGELGHYLKDGETCFFADPDSAEDFAKTVLYAIDNYESAIIVGERGRELAISTFASSAQGKHLEDFLLKMKKKKS